MEGTKLTHIFGLMILSICLGLYTENFTIFSGSIIVWAIVTFFIVKEEIKGDEKH